jgi:hypothetical protein
MTNRMKVAALAVFLAPGAALADDPSQDIDHEVEMQVIVAADAHGTSTVHFDSSQLGFNMEDLAVGETRVIENDAGRQVSMTRTENGIQVDVDGRTIEVPHISMMAAPVDVGDIDVDVEVIESDVPSSVAIALGGTHAIRAVPPDGVMIMSPTPLDASVRESIRSVLISAGIDEEVRFIDGSEEHKQVHVIKRVETL